MPISRAWSVRLIQASLLLSLCACHGGGGSTHNTPPPATNIDLKVVNFAVSPDVADPEDTLTLSGTIQNVGTETANPVLGDKFLIAFNLSLDGTFELNEQGFLQKPISDPIPPGGSLDFNYTGAYSGGDTLATYANFCTPPDPGSECVPPETGVIGVKVDFANAIGEIDEGNNFAFTTIDVVGTRVGATFGGCDIGTFQNPGCELQVSDGFGLPYKQARPSLEPANQVVFPNDLQRNIYVTVRIINCYAAQSPGGSCGGSWTIVGTTQKPGLEASTKTLYLPCRAEYPSNGQAACTVPLDIRDPNY
jgi:hypothetical protein